MNKGFRYYSALYYILREVPWALTIYENAKIYSLEFPVNKCMQATGMHCLTTTKKEIRQINKDIGYH
jgi:hypothetical protein